LEKRISGGSWDRRAARDPPALDLAVFDRQEDGPVPTRQAWLPVAVVENSISDFDHSKKNPAWRSRRGFDVQKRAFSEAATILGTLWEQASFCGYRQPFGEKASRI